LKIEVSCPKEEEGREGKTEEKEKPGEEKIAK